MSARSEVGSRVRGLYGIADAGAADGDPVRLGAAMLEGGCRLIQLRCKGWALDDVRAAARDLRARCVATGATFLVNDHPEVAAEVDADGVHVGQLDADPATVRRLVGPHRIVGRSTNDPVQVPDALREADYVAFGPVWSTPRASREKEVQGLARLAEVRALVPPAVPLVAIGGIDAARVARVVAAGADAWAVIGAIARHSDPVAATSAMAR